MLTTWSYVLVHYVCSNSTSSYTGVKTTKKRALTFMTPSASPAVVALALVERHALAVVTTRLLAIGWKHMTSHVKLM